MKLKKLMCVIFIFCLFSQANAQDIFSAAAEGNLEKIKQLISEKQELVKASNESKKTALHIASEKGHLEIVKYLLENGADTNAKNKFELTPLFSAAENGNLELAEMLIEHKADVNAFSQFFGTALHRAVYMGHPEVAKYLLEKGAEVTAQNSTGTVLHTAALLGRPNLARLLIENGADVNSKNSGGITPLYYAISTGKDRSSELAMLFINNGADVNAADKDGTSVLMMAVQQGYPEVVKKLIMKGADKTIRSLDTGQSLLHFAAIYGYGDVAEILIQSGLDVNAKDGAGKIPLYYAQKYGHKTVADPLIQAGAKKEEVESNFGDSKYLKKKMKKGEAYIWLLKNRGYAIKTQHHLFIFDNEETGRKPDTPSIDNGHYSLSELQDQKVLAVYSAYHAHGGPGEFIHTLEDSLENITYLHYKDDRWRSGEKTLYLKGRETHNIYGAEIVTMEAHEIYGMGSLGYLVKVDGLTFFYSPFPTSKSEEFQKEVDFIADQTDVCDFAFIMAMPDEGEACRDFILEKLKPKVMLPMGHKSTHKYFRKFAESVAKKFPGMQTSCPVNPGDRFHYKK
jgi:ankyrin repeat protein